MERLGFRMLHHMQSRPAPQPPRSRFRWRSPRLCRLKGCSQQHLGQAAQAPRKMVPLTTVLPLTADTLLAPDPHPAADAVLRRRRRRPCCELRNKLLRPCAAEPRAPGRGRELVGLGRLRRPRPRPPQLRLQPMEPQGVPPHAIPLPVPQAPPIQPGRLRTPGRPKLLLLRRCEPLFLHLPRVHRMAVHRSRLVRCR